MLIELTGNQKEEISVNDIARYLTVTFGWKLTSFPEKMQALDGIIHVCKSRGQLTGDQINVQIKTGKSYLAKTERDSNLLINLHDPRAFKKWKKIWLNVPGVMLFLFADYENDYGKPPKIYWADLKEKLSYAPNNSPKIFIPKDQVLDSSFLNGLGSLTGYKATYSYSSNLPEITILVHSQKTVSLSRSESLKETAMNFYKSWRSAVLNDRVSPVFGEVLVNRVGWKNISRNSRKKDRIAQSWQLLGVAKEIIKTVKKATLIRKQYKFRYDQATNSVTFKKYYYLRAKVRFDHRSESVVYVILRQITTESSYNRTILDDKVWFYNVYEGGRGKVKNATNPFS
ncbi:MAG: hypothetical protein JWQ79_3194 [Mucilaginibacter sp.]|nr:hypothetical protein [Mucilaginibacter sp.]